MNTEVVFLIGFMGAGKSTAGKLLADLTGYSFIDLDAAIELVAGKSISELFESGGEKAFRQIESDVLRQLENKSRIVVATGGGCGANPENVDFMNAYGLCIYLKVQPGVLFHRLAPEKKKRPLLSNLGDVDLMEYILEILPNREVNYRKASKIINAEKPANEVAKEISDLLHYQSFSGRVERIS
jgi:shikimate kinase